MSFKLTDVPCRQCGEFLYQNYVRIPASDSGLPDIPGHYECQSSKNCLGNVVPDEAR